MRRNEAGDPCRGLEADTGVWTLRGVKWRVGVAAERREWAAELSTGVGKNELLLCTSAGACV